MGVFEAQDFDHHETVAFFEDKASGLKAIIAIHSTALGPACGGTRMYPYANGDEALTDVLRLSRGMSYKSAMADLPLGGGKAVIIGNPRTDITEAKLLAYAEAVNDARRALHHGDGCRHRAQGTCPSSRAAPNTPPASTSRARPAAIPVP